MRSCPPSPLPAMSTLSTVHANPCRSLARTYTIFQLTALAWDTDGDGVVEFSEIKDAVKIIVGGCLRRMQAKVQGKPPPAVNEAKKIEWKGALYGLLWSIGHLNILLVILILLCISFPYELHDGLFKPCHVSHLIQPNLPNPRTQPLFQPSYEPPSSCPPPHPLSLLTPLLSSTSIPSTPPPSHSPPSAPPPSIMCPHYPPPLLPVGMRRHPRCDHSSARLGARSQALEGAWESRALAR